MGASSSTFGDPTVNLHGDLLGPLTAPAVSGNWVYVEGYDKISVHLVIATGPTAFLCGSNKNNPLDSDDGVDLVAAGLVSNIGAGELSHRQHHRIDQDAFEMAQGEAHR